METLKAVNFVTKLELGDICQHQRLYNSVFSLRLLNWINLFTIYVITLCKLIII